MPVQCTCLTCGSTFKVSPSDIARGRGKYCKQACQTAAQQKGVERPCEQCGTNFTPAPNVVAAGWGRYCSTNCRTEAQRKQITLTCRCGRTFTRKPHQITDREAFCSTDCANGRRAEPIVMDDDGLTARIPLHNRAGEVVDYAIIDAPDAEWAGRWQWYLDGGYAKRGQDIRLHRELLGMTPGDGFEGDHRNMNRLDNRRSNLRVTTRPQNAQNKPSYAGASSQYRGVAWSKQRGQWTAYCQIDGKQTHLGYFLDETDAAEAARAARAIHLPYATN